MFETLWRRNRRRATAEVKRARALKPKPTSLEQRDVPVVGVGSALEMAHALFPTSPVVTRRLASAPINTNPVSGVLSPAQFGTVGGTRSFRAVSTFRPSRINVNVPNGGRGLTTPGFFSQGRSAQSTNPGLAATSGLAFTSGLGFNTPPNQLGFTNAATSGLAFTGGAGFSNIPAVTTANNVLGVANSLLFSNNQGFATTGVGVPVTNPFASNAATSGGSTGVSAITNFGSGLGTFGTGLGGLANGVNGVFGTGINPLTGVIGNNVTGVNTGLTTGFGTGVSAFSPFGMTSPFGVASPFLGTGMFVL